ncbi:sigma-54 interaction domain-containing protein [Fusibacter bizertensis]
MTDKEKIIALRGMVDSIQQHCILGEKALMAQDILSYQKLYDELMTDYLDFREVSDHLFDGIYISDGEGRTVFVNEAYSRITGIDKSLIVGRTVKEITEEGKLFKGAVTMKVIASKSRVSSIGKSLITNREHLVTGSPLLDEQGNVRMVVINNRDITELRALENEMSQLKVDKDRVDEEVKFLRKQLSSEVVRSQDHEMQMVFEVMQAVAPTDVTVLITGESGTGKEIIADEIYKNSKRNDKPFIKINCAAIPAELLESELFGYEKGAFTDANKSGKIGLFELAHTGTILLDEIGDMSLKLQSKLLRVLQSMEITRIGGSVPIKLDVRIIASTNKDLHEEMKQGRFREDLYYRLNVIPIHLKPLRDRKNDVILFAKTFLERYNKKYGKKMLLDAKAEALLMAYDWPGNIREIENVFERIVVIHHEPIVQEQFLRTMLHLDMVTYKPLEAENNLKDAVERIEKEMILDALALYGSINKAAKGLGLSQPGLSKKCKKYQIKFQQDI